MGISFFETATLHPRRAAAGLAIFLSAAFLTHTLAASSASEVQAPVEFRGYFTFGEQPSFGLRDLETGASWWMYLGQERFGFRLEGFNPQEAEITVTWNGQRAKIPLKESSATGGLAVVSSIKLSPIIQEVYERSEKLIKTTRSKKTGRMIKDHRKVEKLRSFLMQNPSVAELHNFLPEMDDSIDYDEFLKIEFPKGVQGRNKQNTARWGIDKSLDLNDIEELIASNPTKAKLDAALREKSPKSSR